MARKCTIPSYRLHKASGQALVHIDGKDRYLGPHGSPESRAKYQELVRKLTADRAAANMHRAVQYHVGMTMAELMLAYLKWASDEYAKNGKPTSQVGLIRSTLAVVRERCTHLEVEKFGPLALKECREGLVDRGYLRSEVNRRVCLVRQMFGWAVAEELISESVLVRLQQSRPSTGGRPRRRKGIVSGRSPTRSWTRSALTSPRQSGR